MRALLESPRLRGRWSLFLAMAVLDCAGGQSAPKDPEPESGGTVITREDILAMGVQNALEALERARTSLVIQRTRAGEPARIYHRGVDSLILQPDVQVAVDGALVQDGIRALESIPASSILFIQVLSAREAALKYGAAAGNGMILVRTGAGAPDRSPGLPS